MINEKTLQKVWTSALSPSLENPVIKLSHKSHKSIILNKCTKATGQNYTCNNGIIQAVGKFYISFKLKLKLTLSECMWDTHRYLDTYNN